MAIRQSWSVFGVASLLVALAGFLLLPTTRSSAQVQDGATMTVLRGQVAVVRTDGSAVQPAPSGTVVNAGDEVRTLGSTSALITFFSGTEIELDQNTTITVDQVSRQGDRIEISLSQAFGATVNRVQTLAGSGSTYRIEAGGAVALVKGTTFVMIGPITTSAGNVVILVCGSDCGSESTFVGCPLAPFVGYGVLVDKGMVESECIPFAVSHTADLTSAAYEAITTIEQALQGDTRGVPPGQVQPGQRQEIETRSRRPDDDDPIDTSASTGGVPALAVNDVSVTEGGSAAFTVTLSAPSSLPVTVAFATANGTAATPADYVATNGTLTIPPGATTGTIFVPTVADLVVEPPENFAVNLSGASGATIADLQGVGTIVEVGTVTLSIDDVTAAEGTVAVFTVTLSAPSSQPVTVSFATANGTAIAPGDYTPASGTLTFPPGTTTRTIVIPILDDTASPATVGAPAVGAAAVEPPENFAVNLSGANGATITDAQGVGTITDPVVPTLSINDVSATEGTNATFTVTMSASKTQPVTVNFATANGTAQAPGDYTAGSGSVTIPAGSTTVAIAVATVADAVVEPAENFAVNLSGAVGAAIADAQGVGTIVDNGTLTLSINNTTAAEGGNATFTVTMSALSSQAVTVNYATANGTAVAPADYTAGTGTATIPVGSTTAMIVVPTVADVIDEVDETFVVNLSGASGATITGAQGTGTILDDDAATLSINDASAAEGANVLFTVTLSLVSSRDVTVHYATANGTALAPGDYAGGSGPLTIPAGSTTVQIAIPTVGDVIDELDEAFLVNLSSPTNATIGDGQGAGTILDDDTSGISINDVGKDEGNACTSPDPGFIPPAFKPCETTPFEFTVTLSPPSDRTVEVGYATGGGTATGGPSGSCQDSSSGGDIDYETVASPPVVSFAPGETSKAITVYVCADEAYFFLEFREGNQTFFVNLSGPTGGATITDGQGLGTIVEDDTDFFEGSS